MALASVSNFLAVSLATLFLLDGIVHVIGPRPLRALYRSWNFAPAIPTVVGIVQLLAGLFLAVPQTRIWGGILAAAILFVTVVWFLNRGKYLYAIPAIVIMVAIAPALAGPI